MLRPLALAVLLAGPAVAGGLDPVLDAPPDDPCATPMQSEADYKASVFSGDPEEFWQMALALRAARCGDVEPPAPAWEVWREKGVSDADLMAAVFNGTRVPPQEPSPIPLPASIWLLLAGLAALSMRGRLA